MSTFAELQELLIEGVKLAEQVVDNWDQGVLQVEDVEDLEAWTVKIRAEVLPSPRLTLD